MMAKWLRTKDEIGIFPINISWRGRQKKDGMNAFSKIAFKDEIQKAFLLMLKVLFPRITSSKYFHSFS